GPRVTGTLYVRSNNTSSTRSLHSPASFPRALASQALPPSPTRRSSDLKVVSHNGTFGTDPSGQSNSFSVSDAGLDHFAVAAPGSATAGKAFSFTDTDKDDSDNTLNSYTGTIYFTSSDGQAVLPANYPFV